MTDFETTVAESFERVFPVPVVIVDWDDVLARTGAEPGSGTQTRPDRWGAGAMRPLRRRHRLGTFARRSAVAASAIVVALAAAVLFWPTDRAGDRILDRALAAVGAGPVIHVELHPPPVEVYDLEQETYGSVPVVLEQWFEPSYGLHEVRIVGSQLVDDVLVNTPAGFLDDEVPFAGVATTYRRALDTGNASLGAEETVRGRRVHWIRFSVDFRFAGTEEHEVAVDAKSFEPRFFRVDGGPIATVATFETAPLDEGDFRQVSEALPEWLDGDALWSWPSREGPRSPAEARAALEGALWLGEQFRGLPLASIRERDRATGVPEGFFPKSVRTLELCYGAEDRCAVSVILATLPHRLGAGGHRWPFVPPRGTLAFEGKPGVGFMTRRGVYATLLTRDRDELVAAAKSLTPIP
jgi:hypothetical protein